MLADVIISGDILSNVITVLIVIVLILLALYLVKRL